MTKIQKWSVRFLQVLFFIACVVMISNIMQPDTPLEKQLDREMNVRVACIIGIKQRLRYPASIEIKNRTVLNTGENEWIAEIGIRAKNNFNVKVPLDFVCTVCLADGEYKLKTIMQN